MPLATYFGILSLYFGGFWVLFASLIPETCTGGSADGLMLIVYAIPLYAIGSVFLYAASPAPKIYLYLLPMIPVAIWQLFFSVGFGHAYIVNGYAACDLIGEYVEFVKVDSEGPLVRAKGPLDGREAIFVVLWTTASIILVGGVGAAMHRSRSLRSAR